MNPATLEGKVIEAVVLDLDGTLIHTTVDFPRMRERLLAELGTRGVPPPFIDPRDTIVSNVARAIGFLRSAGRGEEETELRQRVGRLMDLTEMEKVSETMPVEGAGACLAALKGRGLRTAVLTRGSRRYATEALRYADLDGFDAMVCRDDHPEEEAKPNGKAMERVALLLGSSPEKCLVVGDHLIDLTCARACSAPFVGVLTGSFRREDWEANGRPRIIDSVADLPALLGIGKG